MVMRFSARVGVRVGMIVVVIMVGAMTLIREMVIAMTVPMPATKAVIGPVQRVKRRDFSIDRPAQPDHHIAQHMIINNPQTTIIKNL
jgi:hypothetical protein